MIGHLSASLKDLGTALGSAMAKYVLTAVFYLMPNLSLFSFRTEAANGLRPNTEMLLGGTAYALVYVGILLTITILIFNRRNFK